MLKLSTKLKNSLNNYRFIDLFAGIGGFHRALDAFGAKCVFVSEWDAAAQDTYFDNYGIRPVGDITKMSVEAIPPHDIICGGFPCQAFSISGKQLGFEDARGTLFFDVARIAQHHQPKMLFLENVKNFARHDSGRTLKVVTATLDELGYDVHYKVLNASEFGVPQARERVYILAFRKDLNGRNFQFPHSTAITRSVQDVLVSPEEAQPFVVSRPDIRLRDPSAFPSSIVGRPVQVGSVNKGAQGERIYHPLGQAITLSAYGGGAGAKTGLYLIDGVVRKLTPRECARLLGQPEHFRPHPSRQQAYKQFGNSVVVDVLQHVLKQVVLQGALSPAGTSDESLEDAPEALPRKGRAQPESALDV
jgi:DNA (cytosine-5)-methyltransferase 1